MRVPISWLKEYVDINIPTEELAERITLAGLEVATVEKTGDWWDPEKIVVGQVTSVKQHPDADRLVLIEVDYGGPKKEQVVTGAPNLFKYREERKLPVLKVAFARSGAQLIDAHSKKRPRPKKKLKRSKIRGVPSSGMACSQLELGLSEEHEGIILLPENAPTGTPLRDYMGDEILDIDITPDMARGLSIIGIAQEVAALTGAEMHLPADKWYCDGNDKALDYIDVEIEDPKLCNRYIGVMIKDVNICESPRWMQERLRKCGLRPINNAVDITNYVLLEYGQPLHAFDYDFLVKRAKHRGGKKPKITVRMAKAKEKIKTIDGEQRELSDSMLLITDAAGPIAIAGVMGGAETEVGEDTENILLEAATFEGINNRRTSQKLKLISESSYRFTRGVPATLNAVAARRAADLMQRYCKGRIVPELVDNYQVKQETRTVYTTESEVRRQLGINVSLEQIIGALKKLDFNVEIVSSLETSPSRLGKSAFGLHIDPKEALLKCTVPWHRLDIAMPADVTEEIARIIGYEHIETTLMADTLPLQAVNPMLETEEKIRDILVGCGLDETINYALTTVENHEKLGVCRDEAFVTLANRLSANRAVMRRSLLVSAIENLAYNTRFADRFANFEIGRIYLPEQNEVRPLEQRRLCILLSGRRRKSGFHNDPIGAEEFDFFDAKGVLEELFAAMGLNRDEIEFTLHPGSAVFGSRCADITIKGRLEGIVGELHPHHQKTFELPKQRICLADINIEPLVKPSWGIEIMPQISSYPPVVEDLALVVPDEVTAAQLSNLIYQTGGSLVSAVDLFDIYRGAPLAKEQKSLAYRICYQSMESTLSDAKVEKVRNKIIKRAKKELGAELRPE